MKQNLDLTLFDGCHKKNGKFNQSKWFINREEIFLSNSLKTKILETLKGKKIIRKLRLDQQTSKAIQDRTMIRPASITNMEQCLRHLTTTTIWINYVNEIIKNQS
jgi:hypothetical protein